MSVGCDQGRPQDSGLFIGGPRSKGRRPRAGGGVLGEGQQPPLHQLGMLGSAVSSPSGVRSGARQPKGFHYFQHSGWPASPDTIILLIVDYHAVIGGKTPVPLSPLRTPLALSKAARPLPSYFRQPKNTAPPPNNDAVQASKLAWHAVVTAPPVPAAWLAGCVALARSLARRDAAVNLLRRGDGDDRLTRRTLPL